MKEKIYDLTNPQKSIWEMEQFYKGTPMNNIGGTVLIHDKIDFAKLIQSIRIFFENNDTFRAKLFFDENHALKQYFEDDYELDTEILPLKDQKDLSILQQEVMNKPFSLINNYLYNVKFFKFSDETGGFIFNVHHLFQDAYSTNLVATKIMNIYASLLKNEKISDPSTSYSNYIYNEKAYMSSDKFQKDKKYWEEIFSSFPDIASLSTKNITPASSHDCSAGRELLIIEKEKVERINAYCKKYKFSPFNFFMSIFAVYIGKVKNLKQFVLGSPILNRTNFEEKQTPRYVY